jgi:hypothetical protein
MTKPRDRLFVRRTALALIALCAAPLVSSMATLIPSAMIKF